MTTDKRLRADARRNRDTLLAKAREIFEAGGFDLRFDDFARLAGVGVGTLYRHFPTREALAEAVYREEVATMCAHARELGATLPPAEALAAFLRGFVSHLHAHQGLARTLATLMATRPGALTSGALTSGALTKGSEALAQAIGELLAAAAADGTIRDDVGVGPVMMALHGISAAYDRPGGPADADGVVTLVLDGLRHRPPATDQLPDLSIRAG
ncbi:TetR/AcrR family transcriptional regulator [Actinoplanes subtropicus]|uniref:TetR/AcrR family transcriptional regulator n=1 Tax=Actinoplanes subtropicus TaxID=543632 RepID=UPI0005527A9F|nr:TetR/AcrR family transcriptional regulator [Actinoplanes subtropicus]